ncbi:hypothetical protein CY34DRAFT_814141 [Suillus luteus UH-Slu-Lm8-n1]|uniref:Uncharacterized protein n=1 Tax=Suillus luteus UH-Slu-Lm8-n1 TaxID=930992 RepID=A0A0C9ZTL4_9AGAM|nr:hypothetical protein CY34DRAFT_814141 [Suillus luteus UH-Slu-Lm8-n1]
MSSWSLTTAMDELVSPARYIQIHSQTTPLSARGRTLHKSPLIARMLNVIDARFRRCAEELLGGTLLLPLL